MKKIEEDKLEETSLSIAEAILSPTRTFLPVLQKIKEKHINISGIIHCSGGGLTKSINFGKNIAYIKDNANKIKIPPIFKAIKETKNISDYYMYQTFNMGIGMEIIVETEEDAKKIGHTEETSFGNRVEINNEKELVYTKN